MSKKAILLSKAQSDLKTIVSTDTTRMAIRNINITQAYAEATDGHMILRVPHDGMSPDEFPTGHVTVKPGEGLNDDESVLIEPKTLEKAFKFTENRHFFHILSYVHLSLSEEKEPLLSATDLEVGNTSKQNKVEWEYPNTESFFHARKVHAFTLDGHLLGRLVDWARNHGQGKKMASMRFFLTEDNNFSPIGIEILRSDGPSAVGVIMPMKDETLSKETPHIIFKKGEQDELADKAS